MSNKFIADLHRAASKPTAIDPRMHQDIERGINRALRRGRTNRTHWIVGGLGALLVMGAAVKYGPAVCADVGQAVDNQLAEWDNNIDQSGREFRAHFMPTVP